MKFPVVPKAHVDLDTLRPRFSSQHLMARSRKPHVSQSGFAKDLWINPQSNLRGPDGDRAWDNQGNISSHSGARFLELADTALGLKRPTAKKKRADAVASHSKSESIHAKQ